LRTYESDVAYACGKFLDPTDGVSKWFCGQGTLAAGVPAYTKRSLTKYDGSSGRTATPCENPTQIDYEPRVAMAKQVSYGGFVWSLHFEFVPGLGVISRRIAAPTGFTQTWAWNLNPNDGKVSEYLAAIAIKASTNVNGARISVYDHNGSIDATRLNDCESDGATTYYAQPDVGSNGTLIGIYLNVSVSPALVARCGQPGWSDITTAPTLSRTLSSGQTCSSIAVGGHGQPVLALNTGDTDPNRGWCPNSVNQSEPVTT